MVHQSFIAGLGQIRHLDEGEGRGTREAGAEGRAEGETEAGEPETKESILFYSRQRKCFLDFSISSLNQFIFYYSFITQTNSNLIPRKFCGFQHQQVE